MIKHTIQEIINWAQSFSFLEIATQKECFFCFIWVLKVSLRLTLVKKGGLCPLRLLSLMIEFSVCAPSGYSSREELARRKEAFLKDLKVICKIKMSEMKTNNTWRLKLYYG